MVGLLGGDGMVANFHPPKRGPLCPCHFCVSTCGDLSAIRQADRRRFTILKPVAELQSANSRLAWFQLIKSEDPRRSPMPAPLLTDDLWSRIEPLLPKPRRKNRHVRYAGRKPSELRRVVQGILFVLQTGIPWRRLPATTDFPSGYPCRRYLRRWHKS